MVRPQSSQFDSLPIPTILLGDTLRPQMAEKFYITTPIYYPNADPHLGHVYTTICADTIARYHRLAGHDTFFLTGTDEHGIKMVKTASDQKIEPRELADRVVAGFEPLGKELKVTHHA